MPRAARHSIRAMARSDPHLWARVAAATATVVIHALVAWLVFDVRRFEADLAPPQDVRLRLTLLPAAAPPTPVAPRLAPEQVVPLQAHRAPAVRSRPQLPPVEHPTRDPLPAALPSVDLPPSSTAITQQVPASDGQDNATSAAAAPAPPPAPPAPAAGMSDPGWEGRVLERLQRFRRYPSAARALRQEGVVFVRAMVDRQGRVIAARVQLGSGYLALDDEALGTFARAQPLPRPPHTLPDPVELEVPVEFFLQ